MKVLLRKILTYLLCFLFGLLPCKSQYYCNKFVQVASEVATTSEIYEYNDGLLFTYVFIDPFGTLQSNLVWTDFDNVIELELDSIAIGAEPISIIGDDIYITGRPSPPDPFNRLKVIHVDPELSSQESWQYETNGTWTLNAAVLDKDDDLYILNVVRNSVTELEELELHKVDTSGVRLWRKSYSTESRYSYPWSFVHLENGNMGISQNYTGGPLVSLPRIIEIDDNGIEIQDGVMFEKPDSGGEPIWLTELSDGRFVTSYRVNRRNHPDFPFEVNDEPIKFEWFNSILNGIKQKYITTPRYDRLTYFGLQKGKGDYFFAYGMLEETLEDIYSGHLTKYSNDGDTIWTRKYLHPQMSAEDLHFFLDIVEKDNGDIILFGSVLNLLERKPWIVRVNDQGCFGTTDCSDTEPILTKTEEELSDVAEDVLIYPNPVKPDISLNIELSERLKDAKVTIMDASGKKIRGFNSKGADPTIDIRGLLAGIYIILIEKGPIRIKRKVVVQ